MMRTIFSQMASSINQLSLFLLLITLSSSLQTHARDSRFFNKISAAASTATKNVAPDAKQPNFLPENQINNYGLYARDSSKLPPSATTTTTAAAAAAKPLYKYLPKNYNPVAYVTEPENVNESPAFTEENNSDNYHYNGGGSLKSDTGFRGGATNNGGGFQPQGMSDTKFMENGKYYYDIDSEKYSRNHPYESLKNDRARNEYYNKNFYGNSENAFEFNGEGRYQSREEFEDEVNNNLP